MCKPRAQVLVEASFSIGESRSRDVSGDSEGEGLSVIRSLDDPIQRSVESLRDLLLLSFLRIEFGSGAKSFRRQVLGVGPNAGTNVVSRYYQRAAVLVLSP